MGFDYAQSGLPDNDKWKVAAAICEGWLNENMSMFGPERIASFMTNQPVSAARRIMDNCNEWSEESVTLALLGPGKGLLAANPETEGRAREFFGDRTVDLLLTLEDPARAKDADMTRDANRIFIVEAVSAMNDQMIGRKRIDRHHQVRWNMIADFEKTFATVKGQDPGLDKVFEDAMKLSKEALTALDQEAAVNAKKQTPKHKPPGL
jgi:hypothetical protein